MRAFIWGGILVMILGFGSWGICGPKKMARMDVEAYFDVATGHKYIKNSPNTFAEYSRRGELLKASVLLSRPVLSENKNIKPITGECYILYEKSKGQEREQLLLPAGNDHPQGFYSMDVFYSYQ